MKQAFVVGISVMAGILIGRIQLVENHEANDAMRAADRADKRATTAQRDATRTRVLLDAAEKRVVSMWQRLEPMLVDFTSADSVVDRAQARQRIDQLRWEMQSVEAKITASRELATGVDARTAMRQAFVKDNFGGPNGGQPSQ
jgi:hypothetical protein